MLTTRVTMDEHAEMNAELERLARKGAWDETATLFIERYGAPILAFLADRAGNPSDVSDIFASFAEAFWRGLPSFRWETSLRAWAFRIARNACFAYYRAPHRRRERLIDVPSDSRFAVRVAAQRSSTAAYLRTYYKKRIRALRLKLDEEEQALLVLRVDQDLPWEEIAMSLHDIPEDDDGATAKRLATNLRQRFQTVRRRLRALAEEEGLISDDE